jgi:membrane-bound lytic murein transglycosylase B
MPGGAGGPAFLVTRNFKVIKTYNNSTAYALGVSLLGDRIAGWPPLKGNWPVARR